MRERFNHRIDVSATELIVPWRGEIGRFIAEVVRSWESKDVVERIELAVGRDLQYIRMNGTLVGALVGCAIWGIGKAVGW